MTAPDLIETAKQIRTWLATHENQDQHDLNIANQLLKLQEETGEAAAAWIGIQGQNPRKGVTHIVEDLINELVDVAITALVTAHALHPYPQFPIQRRCRELIRRINDAQELADQPAETPTVHDWQPYIHPRGRHRGHTAKQRRCTRCALWETSYNQLQPCTEEGTP